MLLASRRSEFLKGTWSASTNHSRFDAFLPGDFSFYQISLFDPGLSVNVNSSEIFHSGIKLDDPVTKKRSHDYLLLSSPRRVKENTVGIMLLARVPTRFELWPENIDDDSFSLMVNIVSDSPNMQIADLD